MAEVGDGGLVNARIVYWGDEGAGKRTNLQVIRAKLRPDHRGDLRAVPTALDPTVTYSVLPIELGQVGGVRTRIQVVAVPGGPEFAPTRKQLLDQVDGVVFVADTRPDRLQATLESFEELRSALGAYGRGLETVPLVIQYNKRDLGDPFTLEELHRKLSTRGVAAFEAVATEGTAVLQTLTTISKRVIRALRETEPLQGAAPPDAAAPEPAAPIPQPVAAPAEPQAPLETLQPTQELPIPEPTATRVLEAPDAAAPATRVLQAPDAPEPEAPETTTLESGAVAPAALVEAGDDADVHGTRAALDASFEEARLAAEGESLGRLRIVSLETPHVVDDGHAALPMVVEDEQGRRRRLTVTVGIDVEDSGAD